MNATAILTAGKFGEAESKAAAPYEFRNKKFGC